MIKGKPTSISILFHMSTRDGLPCAVFIGTATTYLERDEVGSIGICRKELLYALVCTQLRREIAPFLRFIRTQAMLTA